MFIYTERKRKWKRHRYQMVFQEIQRAIYLDWVSFNNEKDLFAFMFAFARCVLSLTLGVIRRRTGRNGSVVFVVSSDVTEPLVCIAVHRDAPLVLRQIVQLLVTVCHTRDVVCIPRSFHTHQLVIHHWNIITESMSDVPQGCVPFVHKK